MRGQTFGRTFGASVWASREITNVSNSLVAMAIVGAVGFGTAGQVAATFRIEHREFHAVLAEKSGQVQRDLRRRPTAVRGGLRHYMYYM